MVSYALQHTELRHWELAVRMIDENVAFLSPTTLYRILSDNELIALNTTRKQHGDWSIHTQPTFPDQIWQADLTYLRYQYRDFYLSTC